MRAAIPSFLVQFLIEWRWIRSDLLCNDDVKKEQVPIEGVGIYTAPILWTDFPDWILPINFFWSNAPIVWNFPYHALVT